MSHAAAVSQLATDLRGVRAGAETLLGALTEEQLTWSPDGKSWSVAQCFEHLRKLDQTYSIRIRKAMDAAERAATDASEYRPSLMGRIFLLGVMPERRLLVPTPRFFRPGRIASGSGAAAIRGFLDQQEEVLDLVDQAAEYDINSIRFASPLSRFVRLTVGDGLTILVRHEVRHLGQAQRRASEASMRDA